jgi:hypothetical protein
MSRRSSRGCTAESKRQPSTWCQRPLSSRSGTTAAQFILGPHGVLDQTRDQELIGVGRPRLEMDLLRVAAAQARGSCHTEMARRDILGRCISECHGPLRAAALDPLKPHHCTLCNHDCRDRLLRIRETFLNRRSAGMSATETTPCVCLRPPPAPRWRSRRKRWWLVLCLPRSDHRLTAPLTKGSGASVRDRTLP